MSKITAFIQLEESTQSKGSTDRYMALGTSVIHMEWNSILASDDMEEKRHKHKPLREKN